VQAGQEADEGAAGQRSHGGAAANGLDPDRIAVAGDSVVAA
jgi:hypothetical protein